MGEVREGGLDPRSDAEFEAAIGRKPAFPLYLVCHPGLNWPTYNYKPGRIILPGFGSEPMDVLGRTNEFVCSQDVVYARLYQRHFGSEEAPLVRDHKEILSVVRDLAPRVHAILVGNDAAETGFVVGAHDGFDTRRDGATNEERAEWVHRCTEFVKRAGEGIRDMGGRPAFGLYHFQAILHAYWAEKYLEGGDPLRKAIQDLEALVIIFIGFSFWMCEGVLQPVNHWDPYGILVPKKDLDSWPFPVLASWLESMECWGGVSYLAGLHLGYDVRMAEGGFRAGVVGELPPPRD